MIWKLTKIGSNLIKSVPKISQKWVKIDLKVGLNYYSSKISQKWANFTWKSTWSSKLGPKIDPEMHQNWPENWFECHWKRTKSDSKIDQKFMKMWHQIDLKIGSNSIKNVPRIDQKIGSNSIQNLEKMSRITLKIGQKWAKITRKSTRSSWNNPKTPPKPKLVQISF